MSDFPAARFLRAGSTQTTVNEIAAAWAEMSPGVQAGFARMLAGISDAEIAQITQLRDGFCYPIVAGDDGTVGGPNGTPFASSFATASQSASTLQRITIASPLAGAQWSIVVPALTYWRLLTATTTLVTSASAGNRYLALTIADGVGTQISQADCQIAVTASQSPQYVSYGISSANGTGGTANDGIRGVLVSLFGCPLAPGYTLASHTAGMDSADRYGAVELWLEQWSPNPPSLDPLGPLMT